MKFYVKYDEIKVDENKIKYIKSHKKEEKKVEQEKQGTWFARNPNLDGKIKIMCSECKKHFPINTAGDIPKYLYCPNCRAKMDTGFAQRVVKAAELDRVDSDHTSDYYRIKKTMENWPDWKKEFAEALMQKRNDCKDYDCTWY